MTIRAKLILLGIVTAVSLLGLLLLMLFFQQQLNQTQSAQLLQQQVSTQVLQLRRAEKDFLLRQQLDDAESFKSQATALMQLLNELTEQVSNEHLDSQILRVEDSLTTYQQRFTELVELYIKRGLNENSGAYGALRNATHALEQAMAATNQDNALITLLQIRRAEKDFMLRWDSKYPARVSDFLNQLRQQVAAQSSLFSRIDQYQTEFDQFVNLSTQIGLTAEQGQRAKMRNSVHQADAALTELNQSLEAIIKRQQARLQWLPPLLFIVVSGALLMLLWWVLRSVSQPLRRLQEDIANVQRESNLTYQVHKLRNDEFGQLADGFNGLLGHFCDVIGQIHRSVESLQRASDAVSKNSQQGAQSMAKQAEETDMVATAANEMGSTALEIAANAERTAQRVNGLADSAAQGMQAVQRSIDDIAKLVEQLDNGSEEAQTLSQRSSDISKTLSVIEDIAEQTNLLALNAAIEAARAGEQGRGFAVVADEVRSLASRTQQSTGEVTAIIDQLQQQTQVIVNRLQQCNRLGHDNAAAVKANGERFTEIQSELTTVNDMTTSIAAAVEEQSQVIEEVNENITHIRDIGYQAAQDAKANNQASLEVKEAARQLRAAVQQFTVTR